MAQTPLTEDFHAAGFMIAEANGGRSRDRVTFLSGQVVKAGHVLGKVEVGAGSVAYKAGNTGNGVIGAVTVGAGAKPGEYKVTVIEPAANGGVFTVQDPDGVELKAGAIGVAFADAGLGFTWADGATDLISGDQATITVAQGSKKYVEFDPAGVDGRQHACAIAWDAVDASAADKKGVAVVRAATVNASELVWKTGLDANQKAAGLAQLAALSEAIIAR